MYQTHSSSAESARPAAVSSASNSVWTQSWADCARARAGVGVPVGGGRRVSRAVGVSRANKCRYWAYSGQSAGAKPAVRAGTATWAGGSRAASSGRRDGGTWAARRSGETPRSSRVSSKAAGEDAGDVIDCTGWCMWWV